MVAIANSMSQRCAVLKRLVALWKKMARFALLPAGRRCRVAAWGIKWPERRGL